MDDSDHDGGGDVEIESDGSDDDATVREKGPDVEAMEKTHLQALLGRLGKITLGSVRSLRARARAALIEQTTNAAVRALQEKETAPLRLSKKETKRQTRQERLEQAIKVSAGCVEAELESGDDALKAELARMRQFTRFLNAFIQKEYRERTGSVNRFHDSEVSDLGGAADSTAAGARATPAARRGRGRRYRCGTSAGDDGRIRPSLRCCSGRRACGSASRRLLDHRHSACRRF